MMTVLYGTQFIYIADIYSREESFRTILISVSKSWSSFNLLTWLFPWRLELQSVWNKFGDSRVNTKYVEGRSFNTKNYRRRKSYLAGGRNTQICLKNTLRKNIWYWEKRSGEKRRKFRKYNWGKEAIKIFIRETLNLSTDADSCTNSKTNKKV